MYCFNKCYCSFFSYALFDMDGNQVPQELVTLVGEKFENILKEACLFYIFTLLPFLPFFVITFIMLLYVFQTNKIRDEFTEDMSIKSAISLVFERNPKLRYIILSMSWIIFMIIICRITLQINFFYFIIAGQRGFLIRCYSGIYVEWRVGLLQMLKPSLLNAGTRYVLLISVKSFINKTL